MFALALALAAADPAPPEATSVEAAVQVVRDYVAIVRLMLGGGLF